jgi:hypothetical protein
MDPLLYFHNQINLYLIDFVLVSSDLVRSSDSPSGEVSESLVHRNMQTGGTPHAGLLFAFGFGITKIKFL